MTEWGSADDVLGTIQKQIDQAQQTARVAQALRSDIDALKVAEQSPRREVTVTVDSTGRLIDLRLEDAAASLSLADLERVILDTARTAARKAGQRAVALAEDHFGEGSSVAQRLQSEVDERAAGSADGVSYR